MAVRVLCWSVRIYISIAAFLAILSVAWTFIVYNWDAAWKQICIEDRISETEWMADPEYSFSNSVWIISFEDNSACGNSILSAIGCLTSSGIWCPIKR